MGCLKLTYQNSDSPLNVVYKSSNRKEKSVQRFIRIDPLAPKYPHNSPYAFSENRVIDKVELEGLESANTTIEFGFVIKLGTVNSAVIATLSSTTSFHNVFISTGTGLTVFNSFYNTGKQGIEHRMSVLGGFDNGKTEISLGTNIFRGYKGMQEFNQRTGILNIKSGKFGITYENDGMPFALNQSNRAYLGDGNDRYRTAAVRINYDKFSVGFNLFTGSRTDYSKDAEIMAEGPQEGGFGTKMPWGNVKEDGTPYRAGLLYVGYGGYKIGIDSDKFVRHPIQDLWAHNMHKPFYLLNTDQPGFKTYSDKITPYIEGNTELLPNPFNKTKTYTLYK